MFQTNVYAVINYWFLIIVNISYIFLKWSNDKMKMVSKWVIYLIFLPPTYTYTHRHVTYRIWIHMHLWLVARYSFGCKHASHPACRKVGTLSYSSQRTTRYLSSHRHKSPKHSILLLYLDGDKVFLKKKLI